MATQLCQFDAIRTDNRFLSQLSFHESYVGTDFLSVVIFKTKSLECVT